MAWPSPGQPEIGEVHDLCHTGDVQGDAEEGQELDHDQREERGEGDRGPEEGLQDREVTQVGVGPAVVMPNPMPISLQMAWRRSCGAAVVS